mmetsp:Transcript_9763/g.24830  ORF Transcript_9763/g.24830 Transcript_9763/m.24830 type:complete len:148 (-) Transcript_9763:64-507(-)
MRRDTTTRPPSVPLPQEALQNLHTELTKTFPRNLACASPRWPSMEDVLIADSMMEKPRWRDSASDSAPALRSTSKQTSRSAWLRALQTASCPAKLQSTARTAGGSCVSSARQMVHLEGLDRTSPAEWAEQRLRHPAELEAELQEQLN